MSAAVKAAKNLKKIQGSTDPRETAKEIITAMATSTPAFTSTKSLSQAEAKNKSFAAWKILTDDRMRKMNMAQQGSTSQGKGVESTSPITNDETMTHQRVRVLMNAQRTQRDRPNFPEPMVPLGDLTALENSTDQSQLSQAGHDNADDGVLSLMVNSTCSYNFGTQQQTSYEQRNNTTSGPSRNYSCNSEEEVIFNSEDDERLAPSPGQITAQKTCDRNMSDIRAEAVHDRGEVNQLRLRDNAYLLATQVRKQIKINVTNIN